MFKKIKLKKGFTLVEILVSMSILLFITVFVLADYRSANQRSALGNAARKLASDIRLAQQFALGEKEFNGLVPMAWGLQFNGGSNTQDKYYIFADFNGNHWFPPLTGIEDSEIYSKIKLPGATNSDTDAENISISEISGSDGVNPDCSTPYAGVMDINFEPPKPDTHIIGDGNCTHPVCSFYKGICVTLKDNRNNATKTVKVSNLGLVEIIN